MRNYYRVSDGDTLSKIARATGTSVDQLKKINKINNPNRLVVGQLIVLRPDAVLGFQALFLDRNRAPIHGIEYLLEFSSRVVGGITSSNGLSTKIFTGSAEDEVRVLVKRIDGTFKEVGKALSGYGDKLLTLISPAIKVDGGTEYDRAQKASGSSASQPKKIVDGDIPDLSFLGDYVGGDLSRSDIEVAAKRLKCEAGLIYAIARQESGHSSFIKIGSRFVPSILYERHIFARYTKNRFSAKYRDISGPAYHRTKKVKAKNDGGKKNKTKTTWETIDRVTGKAPLKDDVYGDQGLPQYQRLVRAYQLDKEAALKACSWGKFQIMGFNFQTAGYKNVFDFVRAMGTGDTAHFMAFLAFASHNKTLLEGLRERNFEKIAEGHNGADWRYINPEYAENIERFYGEYQEGV